MALNTEKIRQTTEQVTLVSRSEFQGIAHTYGLTPEQLIENGANAPPDTYPLENGLDGAKSIAIDALVAGVFACDSEARHQVGGCGLGVETRTLKAGSGVEIVVKCNVVGCSMNGHCKATQEIRNRVEDATERHSNDLAANRS